MSYIAPFDDLSEMRFHTALIRSILKRRNCARKNSALQLLRFVMKEAMLWFLRFVMNTAK
ncbi:MAG TPA: hypothetical protein EYP10_00590 [Armatimonadetes bacterium]|nr:hypothetical protein [Armatimonadota bacterium]